MEHKKNDDMDLGFLFQKIREAYHNLLVSLYHFFQFLLSRWILIVVLLAVGIGYGIYKDANSKKGKETELLVQINYGSGNYVYDAITQLDNKIKERDSATLKTLGLYKNEVYFIGGLEIEPVVNFMDILDNMRENDRNLELMLEQAQYEDELLTSEVFVPEYKIHRISLSVGYYADKNTIDKVLAYLNQGDALQKIKEVARENLKFRIDENRKSVAYMDSLFRVHGNPMQKTAIAQSGNNTFFDINLTNLHLLFQEKATLMQKNEALEITYANATDTVVLLNNPMLTTDRPFLSKKRIVYPVTLLFLFFLISFILYLFKKAKHLSNQRA